MPRSRCPNPEGPTRMSGAGMTVDVRTIPVCGLDRAWTCSAEELALDRDLVELRGEAAVTVHFSRNGREVRAQGQVRAWLGQTCSRCLDAFEQETRLSLDVMYLPASPGEAMPAGADAHAENHVTWYDGVHVEVQPDVRDLVLLSLPMTPHCRPDCRGLCPQCGASLNAGPCACPVEPSTSPFAGLDQLKAKLAADHAAKDKDD